MFQLQSNFINKYISNSVNYVNIETRQSLLKIKKNLNRSIHLWVRVSSLTSTGIRNISQFVLICHQLQKRKKERKKLIYLSFVKTLAPASISNFAIKYNP